jgi:hypothetical protein
LPGVADELSVQTLPPQISALRAQVRRFLREEIESERFVPDIDNWMHGFDPAFSARLATRGWVGMTIPRHYGGHERTPVERFAVISELLAAGAPVAAHWIADRQMVPNLLRFGTEEQKQKYLPAIAQGRCFMAIGMSEPDAGSDLASVRTSAHEVPGGWRVSGSKLWTTGAHVAHALVILVRTEPAGADRHGGLSQLIIDLPSDRVSIRPIASIDGTSHFNEVVFDDAFVPMASILGTPGQGWSQVTAELANERSGPERFMSTIPLLTAWARQLRPGESAAALGQLVASAYVFNQMSQAVAFELQRGRSPEISAALVKDLGSRYEGDIVEVVRRESQQDLKPPDQDPTLARLLTLATMRAPAFTLRGGTNEILRSVVARGLGLR